jgi:hypothetical protein
VIDANATPGSVGSTGSGATGRAARYDELACRYDAAVPIAAINE